MVNPNACTLQVNGQALEVPPLEGQQTGSRMLLDVLRHSLNLKATRMGCGLGQCGACTVLVNGRAANACQTPLWSLGEQPITTLAGR